MLSDKPILPTLPASHNASASPITLDPPLSPVPPLPTSLDHSQPRICTAAELGVLHGVNAVRSSRGLRHLHWDVALHQAAGDHVQKMRHCDMELPYEIALDVKVGHCVACVMDPQMIVKTWMSRQWCRWNILLRNTRFAAVAIAHGSGCYGTTFVVLLFSYRRPGRPGWAQGERVRE